MHGEINTRALIKEYLVKFSQEFKYFCKTACRSNTTDPPTSTISRLAVQIFIYKNINGLARTRIPPLSGARPTERIRKTK